VLTLTVSTRAGVDPQGDPKNINIGSADWSPTSLQFNLDPSDHRNAGLGSGASGINVGYLAATGEWEINQSYSLYDYSYVQVASTSEITGLTFIGASGSDIGYKPYLMTNTGHGLVQDTQSGLNITMRCSSAVAGDFDNDMDEDLYVTCTGGSHNTANRLFLNDGKGKFTEVANAAGAAGIQGAAVGEHAGTADVVVSADYDLDGFLDLLVMNGSNMRPVYTGGPKQLFHNLGNSNNWMEFDLVGTTSNRDGVGSKVYVTSGGKTQYREQNGGYHRWSQNFSRVHVGLAQNTQGDVTVVWPNGISKTYTSLPANHVYQLKQDGTHTQIH
jgi:ASPIC and UnbV/FG-GAP-like repeat